MAHRSARIASKAIELSLRGEEFRLSRLLRPVEDPPSRQTAYRVLDQLREDDWLRCEGHTWKPGVMAQMLGDVEQDGSRREGMAFDAADLLS